MNITSGSESAKTFTGSFTYDATTLAATGFVPLLSFTFTDPAWTGQTLSSTGVNHANADNFSAPTPPVELDFFFAPPPVGAPDNAFAFLGISFSYGSTEIVGASFTNDGTDNPVTYGTPVPVTTPEPSSLALIPLGLGALLVMRKRMGHSRQSAV